MHLTSVDYYAQLDRETLALLKARLEGLGNSRQKLADEIGVSRSAISQALDGKYPGDTRHLRAKIIARYAGEVQCPATGKGIAPAECQALRERPFSACMASRETVRHWQTCQSCPNNPVRPRVAS